jgi:hypothetical protein
VEKEKFLSKHRDRVVIAASSTLKKEAIPYVVFKTYAPSKYVGVDVDLIVPSKYYSKSVSSLMNAGFISIDSIRKKYATGFVMDDNPIILDLHTNVTVAGISYLKTELIFRHTVMEDIKVKDGTSSVQFLDDQLDAICRALHSLAKEAEIKLCDIFDISAMSRKKDLSKVLKTIDELDDIKQLAIAVFRVSSTVLMDRDFFEKLKPPHRYRWNSLERTLVHRILGGNLPAKLGLGIYLRILSTLASDSGEPNALFSFLGNIVSNRTSLRYSVQKLINEVH